MGLNAATLKRKEATDVAQAANTAPGIVEVRGVSKLYDGGVKTPRDTHIDFPEGALTSLLGPSGCGQTTLQKIIPGLQIGKTSCRTRVWPQVSIWVGAVTLK